MAPKARGSSSTTTTTSASKATKMEERWKPMTIECAEGLNSTDFAGLVGLEELNPADCGFKIIKAKRKRTYNDDDDQFEPEPEVAKKKKKKKQSKKKPQESKQTVLSGSFGSDATTVDLNESPAPDSTTPDIALDPSWSVEDMNGEEASPSGEDESPDEPTPASSKVRNSKWNVLCVPEHIISRLESQKMTKPTPIQVATIPAALGVGPTGQRQDIYGAAPTGSGKTLAFAIPMVTQIVAEKAANSAETESSTHLRGLVLTPTRELAVQIKKHIEAITLGNKKDGSTPTLRTALVVGGLAIQKQERILKHQKPDIVIATPGRLWEIISSATVPYLNRDALAKIGYLVIDEADRMVEKGHFEELKLVIGLLNETTDANNNNSSEQSRQTFIFSATLTLKKKNKKTTKRGKKKEDEEANLIALLRLDQTRLLVVDLTEGGTRSIPSSDRLDEAIMHCLKDEKDLYLYYYLLENSHQRTIVFANSIDCLRRLRNLLRFLGLEPLVLHSAMPQKRRLLAVERFTGKGGASGAVLLATDVAARGLDIPAVGQVVHYQCPRTAEIYVHRSGRTARADQSGRSLILCDPQEEAFFRRDISRILGRSGKTDLPEYGPISLKALRRCKERVRLATLCDTLEHGLRKERSQADWFKEAARAAEMDDSEEEGSSEEEADAAIELRSGKATSSTVNGRKLKAYSRQLKALLKTSIVFPK